MEMAATRPPVMMKNRRRPFQIHTRSLSAPMSSCPAIPANGPAAQTRPISWISSPYRVARIQLSTEICTDSARPIPVAGRLSSRKKPGVRPRWLGSVPMPGGAIRWAALRLAKPACQSASRNAAPHVRLGCSLTQGPSFNDPKDSARAGVSPACLLLQNLPKNVVVLRSA